MQASLAKSKQFTRALAPAGNLFLLLVLPELRKQGLTFIAFYALQRLVQEPGCTEWRLRNETGLEDYEVSRACKLLAGGGLIVISRDEEDKRVRVLRPTELGIKIHGKVLQAAAARLQAGFNSVGDKRRLTEAAEAFRKGNRMLRGPMQLTFFDSNPKEMDS